MNEQITKILQALMVEVQGQQNINLKVIQVLVDIANMMPDESKIALSASLKNALDEVIAQQDYQKTLFDSINKEIMRQFDES